MPWFDRKHGSGVKKALFAERVAAKRAVPAWIANQRPEPSSLKTWLSSRPDPITRREPSVMPASESSPPRVAGPAPVPRFSIPAGVDAHRSMQSARPARTSPPLEPQAPPVRPEAPAVVARPEPPAVARPDALAAARLEPPAARFEPPPIAAAIEFNPIPVRDPNERDPGVIEQERRLSEAATALEQSVEELAKLRAQLEPELEQQLVTLAGVIARRVIRAELATRPEVLAALALEGMEALGERDKVVVRMGTLEGTALEAATERIRQEAPRCELIVDPGLEPGECIVRSEFGQVDESIDARLGVLLDTLLGREGERSPR